MPKKVFIAYTGGTIGMRRSPEGYVPSPGHLADLMSAMPELHAPGMPQYTVKEFDPLLDSANMTPADWLFMAQEIVANYDLYDGFIILHGTDTMAYSASALPFIFEGLEKPVILTGSQIPLCETRNDGRDNLITALILASSYAIPEVCLYFGHRLLRGCRAVKVNADGFDAFDSPNFPPLGTVGIDIEINRPVLWPAKSFEHSLSAVRPGQASVAALRLFPGLPAEILRNVLKPPLMGLVLECYGVGNGPSRDKEFLAALQEANERGVVIVDCTQCLRGTVNLGGYASGSALARAGVLSGYDMTVEAALAKLFILLGQGHPTDRVKELMLMNLRGEMTLGPGR